MKTVKTVFTAIVVTLALFGALIVALFVLWSANPDRSPIVDALAQRAADAGSSAIQQGVNNLGQGALDTLATTFPPEPEKQPTKPSAARKRAIQASMATPTVDQPQPQVASVEGTSSEDTTGDVAQAQQPSTDTPESTPTEVSQTQVPPTRQPSGQNGRRARAPRATAAQQPVATPQPQPVIEDASAPDQPVATDTPRSEPTTEPAQPVQVAVNPQQLAGAALSGAIAQAPDLRTDSLHVDNSNPSALTLINGPEVFTIPQQNWCDAVVSKSAVTSSIDPNPIVDPRALELVGHASSLKLKGQPGRWEQILDFTMQCPGFTDRSQAERDIYAMVTGR